MENKNIQFLIKKLSADMGITKEELMINMIQTFFSNPDLSTTTVTLCKAYINLSSNGATEDEMKKVRRAISSIK